ncbi:hypothetical protein RRG08_023833 [Elysia crispata]|uniref:RalBP1-associated Eps domain-containing protein 1 n=1 Tax=Elysia crispata TaxID=231223 RepID=A0AAE0ZVK7_9GAST|nr:hypothetical protein RRG08_023833 [Elysia crispata]
MEGMKLDAREQQYYAELFQACDVEGSGKITGPKATELFIASGVSPDILKQITELCGANRLGHFGRSQFYIALKLIALAQAGLPLRLDALNPGVEIQLPKFASKGSEHVFRDRKKSSGDPDCATPDHVKSQQVSGQLPPPPGSKKSHSRSLSGQYARSVMTDGGTSAPFSPQTSVKEDQSHNSKSPPFSPAQSPPTSPANPPKQLLKQHTAPAMVIASGAATGNSCSFGAGPPAAASHNPNHLQTAQQQTYGMSSSLDSAEASKLLADGVSGGGAGGHVNPLVISDGSKAAGPHVSGSSTGVHVQHGQENGNWTMFEDDENHVLIGSGMKQGLEPPNFDSSSISSEAESVDDVWSITDEQREYYVNQFKTMQQDLNSVIKGSAAKHFFEKSKLPVVELSKIWQLSDLNRDGALSLEEFCIAMHLVVLRRNDIELPDHLPLSLMPYSALANDEPFAADLPPGSTLKRLTPTSPQQNVSQWTAFKQESPDSSGVSSPAHLANFEFHTPSADPESKIIHPVAMHVKPEGGASAAEGIERGRAFSGTNIQADGQSDSAVIQEAGEASPQLMKQRSHTESHAAAPEGEPIQSSETPISSNSRDSSKFNTPIQGRPRPVPPKKIITVPAVVRGQLPPPSAGQEGGGVQNDGIVSGGNSINQAPPTPPPRPPHGRSMSVDVKSVTVGQLNAPAVPPRVSPKDAQNSNKIAEVRNASTTPESLVNPTDVVQEPSQIVHVANEEGAEEDDTPDGAIKERLQAKPSPALRQMSRDRRDIHMAVRTHKERNTMLTRLNSELNQELQEVMEQRIALEIQLEHLRPFSS